MTDPPNERETVPLLDQALEWIAHLKGGEPTRADIEALQAWRSQSPAHEQAFQSALRLWRDMRAASTELAEKGTSGVVTFRHLNPARVTLTRRVAIGGALAASAAGVAGYSAFQPPFGLWPSLRELSADYRTGKGEQREVALTRDVSLKLNTLTSIAVRATSGMPQIELISGEVAVGVQTGTNAPLIVTAATGRVTAADASLDIRCIDGTVSVACLRGSASIEWDSHRVQVSQNRQVAYSARTGPDAPAAIDPAQATAWERGLLIISNRSLTEAVEEVNRYRPGLIVITNGDLARRIVNGTFAIGRLDSFIAQVEQLFGARATDLPGGIVLLG